MHEFERSPLWQKSLAKQNDALEPQREILRQAYLQFRQRVELLIAQIRTELPDLTLHDITHVDALWRVASEIAGDNYPLNPAEAFVLGGAFLLHDAAHCRAAFPHGLADLRQTPQWQSAARARGCAPDTLDDSNKAVFQQVLFDTLRVLHPIQAEQLPFAVWGQTPSEAMHLLPHDELREAYGHTIGAIARSHWQSPHELEAFAQKQTTAPACLSPAAWVVDWLKLAVLLRTADALHMDAKRAPRFLMQIAPPSNEVSKVHWAFQAKLHTIKANADRQEICITGSPFSQDEQAAWWQAYDTARMADKELNAAFYLLRDHDRPSLAVREVAGIRSPDAFAVHVPTNGWVPVDTEVRISQVHQLVENFGGAKLYGDKPELAVRELLQNALDAVHACRKLGGLGELEGEIEVALEPAGDGYQWLHVTDTGIGMSRYVLTHVLLDFGRSLWRSGDLQGEWDMLGTTDFEAIGQFGIGFFSVFMLGQQVRVTTKRYEAKEGETEHHVLEFVQGVKQRPILREPKSGEKLKRHGTRVSVRVPNATFKKMVGASRGGIEAMLAALAPAIDVNLYFKSGPAQKTMLVRANDWLDLKDEELLYRLHHQMPESATTHFEAVPLSPIYLGDTNVVVGRVGVNVHAPWRWSTGHGVVQGLYAGGIVGLPGLLQCKSQANLARGDAVPNIEWSCLVAWANRHKDVLKDQKYLTSTNSAWLALYGAHSSDLILGDLGEDEITDEVLSNWLTEHDSLYVHEGVVDLDEEDHVAPKDRIWFAPAEELIQLCELVLEDWLLQVRPPDPERMPKPVGRGLFLKPRLSPLLDEVKAIALKAWGESCEWTKETVVVGSIDGHPIERECLVARRRS